MLDLEKPLRARLLEILALLPSGIAIGVLMGVATNAINGWVSPLYFQKIFPEWPNDNYLIWVASIGQGALEGSAFGLLTSIFLIVPIGLISKLRCSFRSGLKLQIKVVIFSLLFWVVGGFNAALIARFFPVVIELFIRPPFTPAEALNLAWVGGSINGLYVGAVISMIALIASFARKWRQLEKQAQI